MPLSEIVQQVGIRDDIQVGYDQPVDGAFAVTLNDTDNGHLVFEDGRTGTKWFMPGDKVYITGVPDDETFSLVGLSANKQDVSFDEAYAVDTAPDGRDVMVPDDEYGVEIDRFYGLSGVFEMPDYNVGVTSVFSRPFLTADSVSTIPVEASGERYVKEYVLDNLDNTYVNKDGSFAWVDTVNVVYTFADGTLFGGNHTFEDLYGDGSVADASYPVVYQTDMEHPLWDVDSDSDYYVSYISDYHSLDGWGITDTAFARDNIFGEVLDGCHFDAETGLLYVPKTLCKSRTDYFSGESDDVSAVLDSVATQLLITSDAPAMDSMGDANFPVNVTVSGNVDLSMFTKSGVGYAAVLKPYIALQLVEDMTKLKSVDWTDMSVYVNGVLYNPDKWQYLSDSGVLVISGNVAAIHTINIDINKQSLVDMLSATVAGEFRETDLRASGLREMAGHLSLDSFSDTSNVVSGVDDLSSMVDPNLTNPGIATHSPGKIPYPGVWKFSDIPTVGTVKSMENTTGDGRVDPHITVKYESVQLDDKTRPYVINIHTGNNGADPTTQLIYGNGKLDIAQMSEYHSDDNVCTWTWWINWGRDFLFDNGLVMTSPPNPGTGGPLTVGGACSHIDTFNTGNLGTGDNWKAMIRILYIEKTSDTSGYMVLGFATSQVYTQQSGGLMWIEWEAPPEDVYVEIQKEIEGKCAEGNPLFDNLSGIKFSVINKDTGKQVATLTTNENGYAKSDKLKYSKTGFDIQEIFIPDNLPLMLNSEKKTIVIDPKVNDGVGTVVIADKVKRDPLRLNIIKRLSNGLAGSLDDLANAGISVVGIPFKFEYIPDLNFTWSQAQGNYSSKVHYSFQAKTVKRGNRAIIELSSTSGCLDSSTISDLKAKGYWDEDGLFDYAAFPPGFIVVSEMPHAGVQLLKTKMLWEIPMNGTSHWVTNNSDDDISYGTVEVPEVTVNNKYKTFIIEFPKVDKDTGESEGQGDAVLDAEN